MHFLNRIKLLNLQFHCLFLALNFVSFTILSDLAERPESQYTISLKRDIEKNEKLQ